MRKRNAGMYAFLIVFVLLLFVPQLVWPLASAHVDTGNYEKRRLNGMPSFRWKRFYRFPVEFDSYINDHLPFRNQVIRINNAVDYLIFDSPNSNFVIAGREDWLFYDAAHDGDPIRDYQGRLLLSQERLAEAAKRLQTVHQTLAEQGKEFVILIVPNKERVYSDLMPARYGAPAEHYPAQQLVDYLKEHTDIKVIYVYDDMMAARQQIAQNIWYKLDTHWNKLGAYIGAQALLEQLGIDLPKADSDQVAIVMGEETAGDLANMMNLNDMLKHRDHEYCVTGYDTHNVQILAQDYQKALLFKAENADPRRLYLLRDSFGNNLAPILASQFNDSCFMERNAYSYQDFLTYDADILVFELVERRLNGLMNFQLEQ